MYGSEVFQRYVMCAIGIPNVFRVESNEIG